MWHLYNITNCDKSSDPTIFIKKKYFYQHEQYHNWYLKRNNFPQLISFNNIILNWPVDNEAHWMGTKQNSFAWIDCRSPLFHLTVITINRRSFHWQRKVRSAPKNFFQIRTTISFLHCLCIYANIYDTTHLILIVKMC